MRITPARILAYARRKTLLRRLMKVEGQISAAEALLLHCVASSVPRGQSIVEIGSYRGRSTMALALGARSGNSNRVYAIDPHEPATGVFGTDFGPRDMKELYRNITAFGVGDLVAVVALSSADAAARWTRPIGLLWIDGDHEYEGARHDFEMLGRHVPRGGLVAFHDNEAEGVARLIRELSGSTIDIVKVVGSTTLGKKR